MLKKISMVFGGLILLFVIAAVALPLLVDVDKFRPKIVQAVNDQINGEFKLGKLELSLWGGLKVKIESLSIQAKGQAKPLLETSTSYLEVSLLSILILHPSATIVLSQPRLEVIKGKDGKLNVMALMKENAVLAAPAPEAKTSGSGIPAIAATASLGLKIEHGVVSYSDEVSGNKLMLDGVELDVQNLGLRDTIELALKLPMKGKASGLDFDGLIAAKVKVTPIVSGTTVRSASTSFDIDASGLRFTGTGEITLQPKMAVKMKIQSSQLNLGSLEAMLPMLKAYQLNGTAALDVSVSGAADDLAITGDLSVKGGKAAYPALLKEPIAYDVKASFTKNSLRLETLKLSGAGLDAGLKGDIENFSAPKFGFALNAKEIDLDKILKTPPAPAKEAGKAEAPAPPGAKENPMAPLAKNPMIANASGSFTANISRLVAKNAPITDISAKATLKNMMLDLESASLTAFDGKLNAKFAADLKSLGMKFSSSGDLKGLTAKTAIATFVPKFQNTLEGKVSGNWKMSGAAYPQSALMHNLNGSVNIAAENGRLRSIDVNDSIKGVIGKVSFLKSVNPPAIDQNFKSMHVALKFSGGVIDANPFEMIGNEKGLNVKGKSKIQENLTQDTYVDVFDPNHVLPKEIQNGKEAVMQLHVTGLLSSPQTDYGYTVERLAKNVVKNQGKQAVGNELKKALGKQLGGKNGDAVNDALKKFGF